MAASSAASRDGTASKSTSPRMATPGGSVQLGLDDFERLGRAHRFFLRGLRRNSSVTVVRGEVFARLLLTNRPGDGRSNARDVVRLSSHRKCLPAPRSFPRTGALARCPARTGTRCARRTMRPDTPVAMSHWHERAAPFALGALAERSPCCCSCGKAAALQRGLPRQSLGGGVNLGSPEVREAPSLCFACGQGLPQVRATGRDGGAGVP
jgi:hypothetical protein